MREQEWSSTDFIFQVLLVFLLLKMAEYLTSHSRMEEDLIGSFVKMYGAESWIKDEGFLTKDNYYQFNSMVQQHLKKLEEKNAEKMLRDLLKKENLKTAV